MKDDLHFLRLWDLYSPLLTATQREITDLYFNYDLSLGEIAEQKGVSRQSVSDCLNKSRKQLESYEEKLSFMQAMDDLSREYSAYMTVVERWINDISNDRPEMGKETSELKNALKEVHKRFGVEEIGVSNENELLGKTFRDGAEE